MTTVRQLAKDRFEQVLPEPLSGKFHTPQEAEALFLYAYECGFKDCADVTTRIVSQLEDILKDSDE